MSAKQPEVYSDALDDASDVAAAKTSGNKTARRLSRAGRRLADLIFPPLCLSCSARLNDHDALCARCWRDITFLTPPLCDRLGIPLPFDPGGKSVSAAALADPPVYDRARAVAAFDGPLRDLIHQLKYADRHDGRHLFGRWLLDAGRDLLEDCDAIVPIPLSRWRLFTRKFNQAQLLATEVSRLSGIPNLPMALTRSHSATRQTGLGRSARLRNAAGRFTISPNAVSQIAGRRLVLIDDVITTGATVTAATKALKTAGAASVDVLALAMTLRR